ncbi:Bifunctional protein PyrR (Includes: Pyrimidine operon regulatory protein; Uracil phosphoribosyltransferase) [Candidatus Zixiibacteriota bacterium]|nr:Bifunctional protein PyrR (Includes: Pyrimidine operon regulatory protein; Uracil phosphoribosyltransferase) [candidate division Zixibacteria bacterium]
MLKEKIETVMNEKDIDRAVTRISHEILEKNSGAESLVLIGILSRGADVAKRIAANIKAVEGVAVPVGLMDINLYRDDIHTKLDQPVIQRTEILFDVVDRNVILVDDVLYTGRTIRAALDQIIDFGRPRSIQLAVLVDRGHRELPIRPDYVGKNIPTQNDDRVLVRLREKDGKEMVIVVKSGMKKPVPKQLAAKKSKGKGGRK